MRKISTKQDRLKKQKRNTLVISLVLVIILALSIFGIVANSFGSSDNTNDKTTIYNGYEFYASGSFWILEQGDFKFIFSSNPSELENVSIESNELNLLPEYAQKTLYIYSDESTANYQIYQNLDLFLTRIQPACLEQDKSICAEDLPIKGCEDNFIVIKKSDKNKLTQQDKCVFIEAKTEDLTKVIDIFLLKILGINE